jgi:hypothetical protein
MVCQFKKKRRWLETNMRPQLNGQGREMLVVRPTGLPFYETLSLWQQLKQLSSKPNRSIL